MINVGLCHSECACVDSYAIVGGQLSLSEGVGEGVLDSIDIGKACEVAVGGRLVCEPSATGYDDIGVGERSAVIDLAAVTALEGDIATSHREIIVAIFGVVVGMRSPRFHNDRCRRHMNDIRHGVSPCATIDAVLDLDGVGVNNARCSDDRL